MAELPPSFPHGPIEQVFPDVYSVTGGYRFGPGISITRNMTILRRGEELVLVNSVRLSAEGEAQLDALGKVAHVVRLGAFHGYDDAYYASRYGVPLWGPPATKHAAGIKETRELRPDASPVEGASVFLFEHGKQREAAMILPQDGGVLLTCDSYQNWTTFEGCSLLGGLMMRVMGFGPMHIGGPWVKAMGKEVKQDLEKLATLPYRHLVPAHGTPLRDTAPEGLRTAIAKRFG